MLLICVFLGSDKPMLDHTVPVKTVDMFMLVFDKPVIAADMQVLDFDKRM